ncbi:intestinal mucin, partial, partial [Pelobates cultripes]
MVLFYPEIDAQCNNNGYYDGIKCICGENFYGSRCEFIVNEIRPDKLRTAVNITVKVWNEKFSQDLGKKSSETYVKFERRFKQQMALVYTKEKIPSFEGLEIISISNGSIVIQHMVLLDTYAEEYDSIVNEIATILKNTNCTSYINA